MVGVQVYYEEYRLMPNFSKRSAENLNSCHADLIRLFMEIIKYYDCTILSGFRNEQEQNALYPDYSKVKFPNSKHNRYPSRAVDVAPFPIDWEDRNRFYHFGGFVVAVAAILGIPIKWGGDWDGDLNWKDQNFHDLPHFELKDSVRSGIDAK